MQGDIGALLNCGSPTCDVCTLGRLPDESRTAWIARLKERFGRHPLPEYADDTLAMQARAWTPPPTPSHTPPCAVCGGRRDENGVCQACAQAAKRQGWNLGSRVTTEGRLVCGRCGEPRQPNTQCQPCRQRTRNGRGAA